MIRKTIQTNKGITADIWEIVRFEWNRNGQSVVALYGWNEEQNKETDEPLDTRVLQFTFPNLLPYGSDVYEKVTESRLDADGNETNEFAGGTKI